MKRLFIGKSNSLTSQCACRPYNVVEFTDWMVRICACMGAACTFGGTKLQFSFNYLVRPSESQREDHVAKLRTQATNPKPSVIWSAGFMSPAVSMTSALQSAKLHVHLPQSRVPQVCGPTCAYMRPWYVRDGVASVRPSVGHVPALNVQGTC